MLKLEDHIVAIRAFANKRVLVRVSSLNEFAFHGQRGTKSS